MITKFLTLSLRPIVVVTNSASNILHHLFVVVIVSIGILSYLELIKSNMNRSSRLFLLRSPLHHRSHFATVDCIELIMCVLVVNNFIHLLESFLYPHIAGANNTQRDTGLPPQVKSATHCSLSPTSGFAARHYRVQSHAIRPGGMPDPA
jgi:hypothetical protein